MNRKTLAPIGVALCSLFTIINSTHAQGTAFTYQGRLNNNGTSTTGLYDVKFTLFATNTMGVALAGPVTNTATGVSNGLFIAMIDFGPGVFAGASNWLEIAVRTNGGGGFTTLAPRQQVTPTPYAITAENLSGTVGSSGLSGNYGSAVTLNNAANQFNGTFTGNGGGLTNLNAVTVGGLASSNLWQTSGNNVVPGKFLGSTNNQPVEIWANNQRVMQFAYASNGVDGYSPNVIGGFVGNFVSNGVVGAVIDGGGGNGALGATNQVWGDFGTVAGGSGCIAGGEYSLAAGNQSFALGYASVALGSSRADGDNSVALGGSYAGGLSSMASGTSSAGGDYSTALGSGAVANGYAATAIGQFTEATGAHSFAAGYHAKANHLGAFVWADDATFADFVSTATNQFCIRAQGGIILDNSTPAINFGNQTRQMLNLYQGGYGIGVQNFTTYFRSGANFSWFRGGVHSDTQNDPGTGGFEDMRLAAGTLYVRGNVVANSVLNTSDRNVKAGFQPITSKAILDKVAGLTITSWHYTNDMTTPHIGPMAQDFYAAFNVGSDDKHISTVDEGGVALAAIQGLNQKLDDQLKVKDSEIQQLKKTVAELKATLERLAHSQMQ